MQNKVLNIGTIDDILQFWQKANIPTMTMKGYIIKLEKLYEEWKQLSKNRNSQYEKHRINESDFREKIENHIFDVAAPDALQSMKIQDDKDFLLLQRQKGRPGSMCGIDLTLARKQERKARRLEEEENRKKKHRCEMSSQGIDQFDVLDIYGWLFIYNIITDYYYLVCTMHRQ